MKMWEREEVIIFTRNFKTVLGGIEGESKVVPHVLLDICVA